MIADEVVKYLQNKNMYAKKQFGQNFLIDKNILSKIIEISNVSKDDTIIEIGPGMGCLTEYLCLNAKKVICYEIDKDMVQILQDTILTKYENVEVINEDFLKTDLSTYNNEELTENVKVVANLPYYITTPIIFKLLSETKIKQFTFMVQKEVGERLTGKPFLEYMKDKILRKLGFSEDAWCIQAPDGYSWGGSGILARLLIWPNSDM